MRTIYLALQLLVVVGFVSPICLIALLFPCADPAISGVPLPAAMVTEQRDYLHLEEPGSNSCFLHLPRARMSPRSLELCTETLGSENGSYIAAVPEVQKEEEEEEGRDPATLHAVKWNQKTYHAGAAVGLSPPPLPRSVLRLLPPRRGSGRLVMEAVAVQQQLQRTQVHRFDGRLVITIGGEEEKKKKTEMAMKKEGRWERKVNEEVREKGRRAEGGRAASFNAYDYCWRKKSDAGAEEEGGEWQRQQQQLTKGKKDEEMEQQKQQLGAAMRGSNNYVPPLVC